MNIITPALEDMCLDDSTGPEVLISKAGSDNGHLSKPSPSPLVNDFFGFGSHNGVHEAFKTKEISPECYPDPDSLHLPLERSDSFSLAAHLSDSMSISPSDARTWAEDSPSIYSCDSSSFDEEVDVDDFGTSDLDNKEQALRTYHSYTASHPDFDEKGRPILSVRIPTCPSEPMEYLGTLNDAHASKLEGRESSVERSLLRGRAFSLCSTDSKSTRMSISSDPDIEHGEEDGEVRIGDVRQTPQVVTPVCGALSTSSPVLYTWEWVVDVEEQRGEGEC